MDRPGVWQVPEGSGEEGKLEKTGCKIICGAPMALAVKGLMMMMMNGIHSQSLLQSVVMFSVVMFEKSAHFAFLDSFVEE